MSGPVEIGPGTPDEARPLLEASHAMMQELFPAESNHYLSLDELRAPSIRFFVARREGAVLGCAALARHEGYGEVKSMFVAPEARGEKLGVRLLDTLEEAARAEGLPLLRLETGDTLHAAHAVYRARGFVPRGPFGAYTDDPLSVFMEKRLG